MHKNILIKTKKKKKKKKFKICLNFLIKNKKKYF